jgi:adrenodoxin-NADP+ reductase
MIKAGLTSRGKLGIRVPPSAALSRGFSFVVAQDYNPEFKRRIES